MKPGAFSTQKLAAEAAAMEARLTALKLELLKDKAKRESAAAAAAAASRSEPGEVSSIWKNGKQGPLRSTSTGGARVPSAQASSAATTRTASGPGNKNTSASAAARTPGRTRGLGTAEHAAPPARQKGAPASGSFRTSPCSHNTPQSGSASSSRPISTGSTSSSGSLDTRSSGDTPTKAGAAKPQWLQQLKQQQLRPVQVQEQEQDPALRAHQQPPPPKVQPQPAAASADAGATGTDSEGCDGGHATPPSLLQGTYDEAAAANSFQEALQQWRQAGSTGSQGGGSATAECAVGDTVTPAKTMSAPAQHTQLHSTTTSTAASKLSGPTTSVKASLGNSSSVEAFLQRLTVRHSAPSSSSAVEAIGAQPTPPVNANVNSSVHTVGQATEGAQGLASQFQEAVAVVGQAAEGADDDASDQGPTQACDSDSCEPFDAFLQQAEHAAAAALNNLTCHTTSTAHQTLCAAASAGVGNSGSNPAATPAKAAALQYHKQLDDVLQAVEQLEAQLQQQACPVRLQLRLC